MTDHPSQDQLIAHALAELEPGVAAELELHLGGCGACRALVTSFRHSIESYRSAPRIEPPVGPLVRLLDSQARSRSARKAPLFRWPAVVLPTAIGITVLFLSGFWIGRRSASPIPPPGSEVQSNESMRRPLPVPPRTDFETVPPTEASFVLAAEWGTQK